MNQTNFTLLRNLEKVYTPEERGYINEEEQKLVKTELQLETATILELRNMRDMVVFFYGRKDDMVSWDKMSAITYVIDCLLADRGAEV